MTDDFLGNKARFRNKRDLHGYTLDVLGKIHRRYCERFQTKGDGGLPSDLIPLDTASLMRLPLNLKQPLASSNCRVKQIIHLAAGESLAVLGGSLDLDEIACRGKGDVHVDAGPAVVEIVQIEADLSIDQPDAHRRQLIHQRLPRLIKSRVIPGGQHRRQTRAFFT
jgi:hypothetical protein